MEMKKVKLIFSANEYCGYIKSTALMVVRCVFRIPFGIAVGLASFTYWLCKKTVWFCREYTKAAVIMGFTVCLLIIAFQFAYFRIRLRQQEDEIGRLIKKNYELGQVDRYDVGYYDAMRKNSQMAQVKVVK